MADGPNLIDENEQLRTALEVALEQNASLTVSVDRSRRALGLLARERNATPAPIQTDSRPPEEITAEEELRSAYEELQVLAEELGVSNTSLQQINQELDLRVDQRTLQLNDSMSALRANELRFRALIEGMPQLVWRSSDGGRWTWSSPQWCAYTGLSREQSLGLGWFAAVHPDDREAIKARWRTAYREAGFDIEARIFHAAENRYRRFQVRALPAVAEPGLPIEWLGTCTDVDNILQLQDQQAVLVRELQHRTRNLMAVVQAVMMRTLKTSRDLDHFRECIDDRLQALARVQGLLSRREGAAKVPFDMLLRDELSAHVELDEDGRAAQVSTEGPSGVSLRSTTVQTLALALHALATNAIKYGALATPDGRLRVTWRIGAAEGPERLLLIDWRESGVEIGAAAHTPQGGGYGRELIERALPYQLGTNTRYVFEDDGVHCTIEVRVAAEDFGTEVGSG